MVDSKNVISSINNTSGMYSKSNNKDNLTGRDTYIHKEIFILVLYYKLSEKSYASNGKGLLHTSSGLLLIEQWLKAIRIKEIAW